MVELVPMPERVLTAVPVSMALTELIARTTLMTVLAPLVQTACAWMVLTVSPVIVPVLVSKATCVRITLTIVLLLLVKMAGLVMIKFWATRVPVSLVLLGTCARRTLMTVWVMAV
jgi:hypothetical protein